MKVTRENANIVGRMEQVGIGRLGKQEKAILSTLDLYHRVGEHIFDWEYESPVGRYSLGNYIDEDEIEKYNAGRRVPVWTLKRDLSISASILSRSLKTLHDKGLVWLFGGDMKHVGYPDPWGISKYTKYAALTGDGNQAVSYYGLNANK